MLNRKFTRITIGIIILIVLFFAAVPYLYKYNSVDAVLNARTTTMYSPIEGILHYSAPTKYGSFFKKGEIIAKIENDRIVESFLYELNTEKKTLEARISSLEERLSTYSNLNNNLKAQLDNFQKYYQNQMEQEIKQANQQLEQEKTENDRAKKEYDASTELSSKQVVTKRLYETHQANYFKSQQRIEELGQKIAELKIKLDAAKNGIFLDTSGGNNDSPYSKQRMDQLVIEMSLARTALNESKLRIEGINAQIEKEKDRLKKAQCFDVASPFDALVWRMIPTNGSAMVIGSEIIVLMDCNSIFLEACVSETEFQNITRGDKIQYKLLGDVHFHTGTVVARRGSGSEASDKNLAAVIIKDPKKEFKIWIEIDPRDIELTPENFYQIGHRADVRIVRKFSPFKAIMRFLNVF